MIQSLALFSILKKSKVAREKVSTVKIEFRSHNPPIILWNYLQELSKNKYYLFLDILNSLDLAKLTTWRGRLIFHRKNFNRINDDFQAIYLLESLIDNFENYPSIVDEARRELEKIKNLASNNNSSMKEIN